MKDKNKIEPYVFILGQSFPRSEIIKLSLIIGFVLLMLTAGGVLFFLDWREGQIARAEKVAEKEWEARVAEEAAKEKKAPLVEFFETYIEKTRFDEVDSIRAVGVYLVNEIELDLTFLAKRPRLYRQTIERSGTKIEFGYDGDSVWFEQTDAVVDSEDPALMNLNRSLAIMESTIPTLAWDYDPKGANLDFELMPDKVWEGHDCYVLKNSGLIEGSPVYHHIDKETGFERYRRASLQIAPRRFKDVELFYDEPLADSKYPIPSGMELYLDGQLYYNVDFNLVQVNQGLPTFLFKNR